MDASRFVLELKFDSCLICVDKLMNSVCVETISFLSMFSSNPLFSFIVTFYTLAFLYIPHLFWKIALSPVLILTAILLFTILRLGATQKSQKENQCKHESKEENTEGENREEKQTLSCSIESNDTECLERVKRSCNLFSKMDFESSSHFVEWNVRAPLEVIYEEYEGEETEDDSNKRGEEKNNMYPSLSRFYPESDSDSSSESDCDWDSPEDICFRWEEEEEDREGLIEIALDGSKVMKREMEFQDEEENLIEIDISPTRSKEMEALSDEISCN